MTFTRDPEGVTLKLSEDDFASLLLVIGYATGAARYESDMSLFYRWMALANKVNEGNTDYRPYEIPEQYRTAT